MGNALGYWKCSRFTPLLRTELALLGFRRSAVFLLRFLNYKLHNVIRIVGPGQPTTWEGQAAPHQIISGYGLGYRRKRPGSADVPQSDWKTLWNQ